MTYNNKKRGMQLRIPFLSLHIRFPQTYRLFYLERFIVNERLVLFRGAAIDVFNTWANRDRNVPIRGLKHGQRKHPIVNH